MTYHGPEAYRPFAAAASALGNRLHRTDPEEPAVVHHTAIPLRSLPSCWGDVVAYWVTASGHASVRVVGRRGDVVGACPRDGASEAYAAPVQGGPVVHPFRVAQASTPFRLRASGHKISRTPCQP